MTIYCTGSSDLLKAAKYLLINKVLIKDSINIGRESNKQDAVCSPKWQDGDDIRQTFSTQSLRCKLKNAVEMKMLNANND